MRVCCWVLLAFGVGAVGAGCASRAAGPKPVAVAAPAPAASSAGPVYRFVPSLWSARWAQLDAEHSAQVGRGGRTVVAADGSVERETVPSGLMGGAPVPVHLGGGFVFWTNEAVYRARTFTGALEPVAHINGNAIGVEFGPSSLLLFTPQAPPHAYALGPGRPVALSPHGALEIAAADAERALAFDAVGRALATVDGGQSWKDVTGALGETTRGIRREEHEVGFVLGGAVGAWLEKDGSLVRRPLADAKGKSQEKTAWDAVLRAAYAGLPLRGSHALTVGKEGIEDVDLLTGQATMLRPKLPYGSSCLPVSVEEQGLLVCFSYDARPSFAVVSHALSEHPEVEKVFEVSSEFSEPPYSVSDDSLVVGGSCAGQRLEGVACVRSPGRAGVAAKWSEVNVQAALGANWQVLRWVPKAKQGGVAAIVLERAEKTPPRFALVDAASGRATPFDVPYRSVAPNGFGSSARNFVVLEDGTLRGFTATSALVVDARGHVLPAARTFRVVVCAGPFALAEDVASQLWQTKDYGAHWVEVARPPFESEAPFVPEGAYIVSNPRGISCSLVGCVLIHESGLGNWVRLGWRDDPPRRHEAAPSRDAAPSEQAPLVVPDPRPTPPRPKLRCAVSSQPKGPGPGKPLVTRGAPPPSTHIEYGDVFLRDTVATYGLRGIVRLGRADPKLGQAFEPLAATKAPFGVELVEPLEPAGRTLRTTGSFDAWTPLLKASAAGTKEHVPTFRRSGGGARPVLGATPGKADGALFVDEDFSFWASHTGRIRPIRPGCRPSSGYADARGALFIACDVEGGATTLWDIERDRTVLSVPLTERFRRDSGPAMSFFAPGRQLLTNVDAVAVGPQGKLAIVRIASGSEPPTEDIPAWLLTGDGAPVELAPWASLEPATSPACSSGDGYRTLIQTQPPWIEVEGDRLSDNARGMSAIVRWSPQRVCLEAVEIGLKGAQSVQVMAVARFTGAKVSAGLVGTSATAGVREAATCELLPP